MYQDEHKYNVIKGSVPTFISGDVILAFTVNNEKISGLAFPSKKDKYTVSNTELTCDDGVSAVWDNDIWGIKEINNPNGALKIKCTIDFNAPTLSEYLETKVALVGAGESGLIKQENEETEQTGTSALVDYRYIGNNPNNYICLEESNKCSEENLYRIIGIIPVQSSEDGSYEYRLKLIKQTKYGDYYWSGSAKNGSNNWSSSTLNTQILNEDYWNEISAYQKYIDNTIWYLGVGYSYESKFKEIYKEERKGNSFVSKYVGLIYPSDYGFATSGDDEATREQCINEYNIQSYPELLKCLDNNWLYLITNKSTIDVWTITPSNSNNLRAWCVSGSGNLYQASCVVNQYVREVYPSFYLKEDVLYKSGNGSHDNPYKISLKA